MKRIEKFESFNPEWKKWKKEHNIFDDPTFPWKKKEIKFSETMGFKWDSARRCLISDKDGLVTRIYKEDWCDISNPDEGNIYDVSISRGDEKLWYNEYAEYEIPFENMMGEISEKMDEYSKKPGIFDTIKNFFRKPNLKNNENMKHIKLFEAFVVENGLGGYSRTLGFRYSEPNIKFQVDFDFTDKTLIKYDLTKDIQEALNAIDVKCEAVDKHENGYSVLINVYNEKEVTGIIDEFIKYMYSEYQAPIDTEHIVARKSPTRIPAQVEPEEESD